jgi:lipocalin
MQFSVIISPFFSNLLHCLVILVISNAIDAQVPGLGSCPRVQIMTRFDLSQFLGTWYGICSYPDKLALDAKCASATFTWGQSQAEGVSVYSRHVSFGKEKKFMGMAKIVTNGVLGVEFPCCREIKIEIF